MRNTIALGGFVVAMAVGPMALAQDYNGGSMSKNAPSTSGIDVGANVDVLDVNKVSGATLGYGVNGSTALSDTVSAGLSLDYWGGSDNSLAVPLSANDLILGAFAKAEMPAGQAPLRPFVVGGVDLHRLSFKGGQTTEPVVPTTPAWQNATRLGLNVGAGAEVPIVTALNGLAELRYRYIFGASNVQYNSLGVDVGLTYQL